MSTTSGWRAATADTAASPLAASPTTVMPSAASRMTQKPDRTSSWSSTTRTRIGDGTAGAVIARAPRSGTARQQRPSRGTVGGARRSSRGQPGGDGETAGRSRAHDEVPAARGDSLGDAGQAEPGPVQSRPGQPRFGQPEARAGLVLPFTGGRGPESETDTVTNPGS